MFSSHLRHFAAGPSPLPAKANLPTGQSPARPITRPIICYVTDRKALPGDKSLPALLDLIRAAAAAGVDWVQIREKDLPARDLFTLVKEAVALASVRSGSIRPRSTKVIVNDRLDVALAAGAAGVHLGHASAPAREVVSWCRAGVFRLLRSLQAVAGGSAGGGKRPRQLHLLRANLRNSFEDPFRQA